MQSNFCGRPFRASGTVAFCAALAFMGLLGCTRQVTRVNVYFNDLGDDLRSKLQDTLNASKGPLWIAMYDFTDMPLDEFLQGQSRSIRVILGLSNSGNGMTKDETAIYGKLNAASSDIQVVTLGDMHHKFAVVQGSDLVITGSANWSKNALGQEPGKLGGQANNLVIIHSRRVAERFEAEFRKLWEKTHREEL